MKEFFKSVGIFMAVSLLASCASMPMATQNTPKPGTQNPPPCTVHNSPQITVENSAERQILFQAVSTGAIVGTVFGVVLEHYLGKKDPTGGALTKWVTGEIGKHIGATVAVQQIQNLRNVQLTKQPTRGAFSEGSGNTTP